MHITARGRRGIHAACLEALESRQLYSVTAVGDVLRVTGTSAADHITVSLDANDATKLAVDVNGHAQSFDLASFTGGLRVKLGKGNDSFVVDETNGAVALPMTVLGGSGNDTIVTGSGDDSIDGGSGHDSIDGGAGDDVIVGGKGGDSLDGDGGDDSITGDRGTDALSGGSDSDMLVGGKGADDLSGDGGDDDLDGGKGVDALTGGDGADAFANPVGNTDTVTDKTDGVDTEYKPFPFDRLPPNYQHLFHVTFPNSTALGIRINDDQTFTMLYRYDGDNTTYHAYFTFEGTDPFANLDGVNLRSYEVAPDNVGPLTLAQFRIDHPEGDIKEVFVFHDVDFGKMANIRFKIGDEDSQWATEEWLDNNDEHP